MVNEKSFQSAVLSIATEGRKSGVSIGIICKEPSDLEPKLLAQCRKIQPIGKKYLVSTI